MQSKVITALDGGTLELVYTTDPKYLDGLSQREIVETVITMIPALLYAATYTSVEPVDVGEVLRDYANMWDPLTKESAW